MKDSGNNPEKAAAGRFAAIVGKDEGVPQEDDRGTPQRIPHVCKGNITMSEETSQENKVIPITKPAEGGLERFRSKTAPTIANVGTKVGMLPISSISEASDFCRVHPDEENHWSSELCFVRVPTQGARTDVLHLIDEDIAMKFLEAKQVLRFRLALASKPSDKFFLCIVPTTNLENSWNASTLEGIEDAKRLWVKLVSRRPEGVDSYRIQYAKDPDAFSEPKWPAETLDSLILATFKGHLIDNEDHPGLLRLIGAKLVS